MQRIFLENSSNQEFDITLDQTRYRVNIREGNSQIMLASVNINGEDVINGIRCLASTPLLPYRYTERGNFIFLTQNDELPYWEKFGQSQRLLYLTVEEVEALRNGV